MRGIFPQGENGGIAPNPEDISNPPQAFAPTVNPADTAATYFGLGCDVLLKPHVINSIISEIIAVIDRAGLPYRTTSLQNLADAITRLSQGYGGVLYQQNANQFRVAFDQPLTGCGDFMQLMLVPQLTGPHGNVRIDVDQMGEVPLLRSDGQEMQDGDLKDGVPLMVAFCGGKFYRI